MRTRFQVWSILSAFGFLLVLGCGSEGGSNGADGGSTGNGSTDNGACAGTPILACPGVCLDLCSYYETEDTCADLSALCEWSDSSCVGSGTICSNYTAEDVCMSVGSCVWIPDSSSSECVAPSVATCSELSSNSCATVLGCEWVSQSASGSTSDGSGGSSTASSSSMRQLFGLTNLQLLQPMSAF